MTEKKYFRIFVNALFPLYATRSARRPCRPGFQRPSISNTYAMDWAFDSLSCNYRSGFDLSVPLRPGKIFPELESTPATGRKYFMTFKVCVCVCVCACFLR